MNALGTWVATEESKIATLRARYERRLAELMALTIKYNGVRDLFSDACADF